MCTSQGMTGTTLDKKWHPHKKERQKGKSLFSTSTKAAASARGSFSLEGANAIPTSTLQRSLLGPWLRRYSGVPWSETEGFLHDTSGTAFFPDRVLQESWCLSSSQNMVLDESVSQEAQVHRAWQQCQALTHVSHGQRHGQRFILSTALHLSCHCSRNCDSHRVSCSWLKVCLPPSTSY